MLEEAHHTLTIATGGPGFTDVTAPIREWLASIEARDGMLSVFVSHTSASLTVQENADADVLRDLGDALDRLAPRGARYRHAIEGVDDMPAHIKSMLTAASLAVPVIGGSAVLGTWQAIYLVEHRDRGRRRQIVLSYIGTRA
jgi:secondary thiamine-phosphate synthase enzyme